MINKHKKIIFFILSIILMTLLQPNTLLADPKRPRYSDWIYYYHPNWLSNEEIVFVKVIEHFKHNYDWLSNIAKATRVLIKKEIQICSMKIDGTDEIVIKNIVINYTHAGGTMHWEDTIFEGVEGIELLDFKNDLIVFLASGWKGQNSIYLMDLNGNPVNKIDFGGYRPKISPDGTKILYGTNNSLWISDIERHNKYKVTDNASFAIWDSEGKRIIYESADRPFKNRKNFIIDLSNNKKEEFFIQHLIPQDWSPDGTKIICGRSIFKSTGERLKINNIPNDARFSPDGTKLVGIPVSAIGNICVVNVDGTGLKILKTDSSQILN